MGECSTGCDRCFAGMRYANYNDMSCPTCPKLRNKAEACHIIQAANDNYDGIMTFDIDIWYGGYGDLVPDQAFACPKMHAMKNVTALDSTASGMTFTFKHNIPTLFPDGSLGSDHIQLGLGRPDRCKADIFVRPLGDVLQDPTEVSSAGACCDLCIHTEKCHAWSMQGSTCTLLTGFSGKHEACDACVSGQSLLQGAPKIVI